MPEDIPDHWKSDVCRILKAARAKSIDWTITGEARWEAAAIGSHRGDAYEAFLKALTGNSIKGRQVSLDYPAGETWEFFFPFRTNTLYGKICLKKGNQSVLILSAHLPDKNKGLNL